jgi:hypothetical protein
MDLNQQLIQKWVDALPLKDQQLLQQCIDSLSFEQQLALFESSLELQQIPPTIAARVLKELQDANAECMRRGYSTVQRFKSVEGVCNICLLTHRTDAEPTAEQRRSFFVPDWYRPAVTV